MSARDFRDLKSNWGQPVSTTYRGYTVYETAPNSQGLAALMILNLLEGYDLSSLGYHSPDHLHLMVEAKKVAFADRNRYISDPEFVKIPVRELLSKEYAAQAPGLDSEGSGGGCLHDRSRELREGYHLSLRRR